MLFIPEDLPGDLPYVLPNSHGGGVKAEMVRGDQVRSGGQLGVIWLVGEQGFVGGEQASRRNSWG